EEKAEFIASTDERFRPVNMNNAPDGTLYMVDMYRGILQAGEFITPYLRDESLSRNLLMPIGLGRIYRIVHDTTQPRKAIAMSKATPAELVGYLSSPNGWTRDMAQQLLVQKGDLSVVPELRRVASSGDSALGRLHALWVLEGLKRADMSTLTVLASDKDPNIRASATFIGRNLAILNPDTAYVRKLAGL